MNDRQNIDAGIDAALAAQVRAPRLDRQFDAAVWRRIAVVADQPTRSEAAPARGGSAMHWLRAGNVAGLLVAVVLAGYYGFQQFGGSIAPEVLVGPAVESGLPWMSPMAWVVTVCALAFGLKFTAVGKWLG